MTKFKRAKHKKLVEELKQRRNKFDNKEWLNCTKTTKEDLI